MHLKCETYIFGVALIVLYLLPTFDTGHFNSEN